MKKVLSTLLVLCLLLGLTACGSKPAKTENTPTEKKTTTTAAPEEETGIALPFGLKFGITYDEFANQLSENGLTANPLKPAADRSGYKPDVMPLPTDDPSIWKFTGSELLQNLSGKEYHITTDEEESTLYMHQLIYRNSTPCVYAAFNQKKELLEFGFIGIYTNKTFATATQNFINALATDITPYYDAFFGTGGKLDDCTSYWENDKYSVTFYQPTTGCYALVIKDCTYADPLPEESASESSSHSTLAGNTTTEPAPTESKPTATKRPTTSTKADPCANGHDWEEATCSGPATCSVCKKTSGSALPHDIDVAKCRNCDHTDFSQIAKTYSDISAYDLVTGEVYDVQNVKINSSGVFSFTFNGESYALKLAQKSHSYSYEPIVKFDCYRDGKKEVDAVVEVYTGYDNVRLTWRGLQGCQLYIYAE